MKKVMISCLSLTLSLAALTASASNYPGDMQMMETCQEQGPVKVCRAMQYSGLAVLNIYYTGSLSRDPVVYAWVRANYLDGARQGSFVMTPVDNGQSPRFVRITGGCVVGVLGGCRVSGTEEMRNLLLWAQRAGMAFNDLSLDVAFVSGNNAWDNNNGFGSNYHFDFPATR